MVVHCAGGPRAPILSESSPRILSDAHPTAMPYAWGGQRPVCMALPPYLRHLNARVTRCQFSGNASFLVRMADMKVKHDIRASTTSGAMRAVMAVEARMSCLTFMLAIRTRKLAFPLNWRRGTRAFRCRR